MIKDISKLEFPREKLKKYGIKKLSDSELLALIISKGSKHKNVTSLSQEIINKNPLNKLKGETIQKLIQIKGIGEVKASQILASIELGRRSLTKSNLEKNKLNKPIKVFKEIVNDFEENQESFIVLLVDSRNNFIFKKTLFIGTINHQVVSSREIVKLCLDHNALKVILAHNHPSGNLKPSNQDITTTKKIKKSLDLFNIELLDHIIVSNNSYFSFKEEFLL